MRVHFQEEMVCAIFQHSRDVSEKQGKFVDVKLEPERIGELPEAKEWPALGEFLIGINKTNLFRTTGCNSNHNQVEGGHAAPFVDIALDDPRLRYSEEACSQMREKILALNGNPAAEGLVIELVQSEATMPDGEIVPSTRLWMLGDKTQAEAAFPLILAALDEERVPDYLKRGFADVTLCGNDGIFAPISLMLDLTAIGGSEAGAYVCQSNDNYATWVYVNDGISIVVYLGDVTETTQWNADITVGGEEACYQGDVIKLPIYRVEAKLNKVQGGQRWPDALTLEIS